MAITLPTIVFVPGAWHSPEFFGAVISILEPLGYQCVTVSMPGVGRIPPVDNLDEDIAAVRTTVIKELDAGHDVIIHAHSWAGIPVNSALDGLSKEEREKDGRKGAVVKLTFASSIVVPENVSLLDAIGGKVPDIWEIQGDGNLCMADPIAKFYHDLEPEQQQYWFSRLKPHSLKESLPTFTTKTKSAAWKKVPSVFLICEDDRAIPVQAQDAFLAAMKEAGADVETERLFMGHSIHLANPKFVAGFIQRAAGEDIRADT